MLHSWTEVWTTLTAGPLANTSINQWQDKRLLWHGAGYHRPTRHLCARWWYVAKIKLNTNIFFWLVEKKKTEILFSQSGAGGNWTLHGIILSWYTVSKMKGTQNIGERLYDWKKGGCWYWRPKARGCCALPKQTGLNSFYRSNAM